MKEFSVIMVVMAVMVAVAIVAVVRGAFVRDGSSNVLLTTYLY